MPIARNFTLEEVRWIRESGLSIAQMARIIGASCTSIQYCRQGLTYKNTSPLVAGAGASAPSISNRAHTGGDVTLSGASHAASERTSLPSTCGASLNSPAGGTQPAGASCPACGGESDGGLCEECAAITRRVDGFGDGRLPHYDEKPSHLDFRRHSRPTPQERWKKSQGAREQKRKQVLA
jgi:hypothetical protein